MFYKTDVFLGTEWLDRCVAVLCPLFTKKGYSANTELIGKQV